MADCRLQELRPDSGEARLAIILCDLRTATCDLEMTNVN
jgi:hypothetical protein